jgi:hypothetical protein
VRLICRGCISLNRENEEAPIILEEFSRNFAFSSGLVTKNYFIPDGGEGISVWGYDRLRCDPYLPVLLTEGFEARAD